MRPGRVRRTCLMTMRHDDSHHQLDDTLVEEEE